jgi:hypothetical protein
MSSYDLTQKVPAVFARELKFARDAHYIHSIDDTTLCACAKGNVLVTLHCTICILMQCTSEIHCDASVGMPPGACEAVEYRDNST